GDEKFAPLPDIFLIDGGAGQAGSALRAVREAGVDVPVFGMVKDDRHRTRALVTADGEEIGIAAMPSAFALVGTIQEEAHRFAVEYHRKLRGKSGMRSELEDIKGIGKKRREMLIKHFGSLKAVRQAEPEELRKLLPRDAAEAVYAHFHGGDR
ncbi:MAG: excinuclease ABC subunit UvrC, partial [Oscillospiraceae bacterium]|nr:excinuclease ABC subunit UvrC [Oscillospiraceae bacterium]